MRKFHRNWLVGGLILGLILGGTSIEGKQVNPKNIVQKASLIQEGSIESTALGEEEATLKPLKDVLIKGMEIQQPSFFISDYELTREEFAAVLQEVLNSSPQLFYVNSNYRLSIDSQTNIVSVFRPIYSFSKNEIATMRTSFEKEADKILSGVQSSWTDVEKIIYIHDTLVKQSAYDLTHSYYDAYHLLISNTAVCQGYSLAFMYFMNELGIPCEAVCSNDMGHMWNMVQVDGLWYHIDLTYDDPTPDIYGAAIHKYLLISDEEISRLGHYNWVSKHEANSTLYDGAFWTELDAPMVYEGGKWFYLDNSDSNGGVYQWNPENNSTTCILSMKGPRWRWYTDDFTYYTCKFSGLANKDGYIFVNSSNAVYYFVASNPTKLYQLKIGAIEGNIYGLGLDKNELKIVVGSDYSDISGTVTVYTFEPDEEKAVKETAAPEQATAAPEDEQAEATATPGGDLGELGGSSGEPEELPGEESEAPTMAPSEPTVAPDVEFGATAAPEKPQPSLKPIDGILVPMEPEESENPAAPTGTEKPQGENDKPVATAAPTQNPLPTAPSGSSESGQKSGDKSNEDENDDIDNISGVSTKTGNVYVKITAKKGARKVVIKTLKTAKVQVTCSKNILKKGKKKYKKITIAAKKNKSGKITIKLSGRLKKKMKIKVTVTRGKKRTVTKVIK